MDCIGGDCIAIYVVKLCIWVWGIYVSFWWVR